MDSDLKAVDLDLDLDLDLAIGGLVTSLVLLFNQLRYTSRLNHRPSVMSMRNEYATGGSLRVAIINYNNN